MENISEHISHKTATHSQVAIQHGINNIPDNGQLAKMKILAKCVFEPLRTGLGNKAIYIPSFFRCNELNKIIKGAKNSQHTAGEAMDIDNDCNDDGPTNIEIFEYIRDNLEFDQLINENPDQKGNPAWVHVSFREGNNRKEILIGRYGKYYRQ